MTIRGQIKLLVIAAACAAGAFTASAATAEPLRVCADPDNLPFSKSDGAERGLYVELAEMVAKRLGSPVEYVWWLSFNQRKALRNTILEDGCDAYFALPFDADYKTRGLLRTQAFLDVSYAVVAPPTLKFAALPDLKGKRIAVQFASTPQIILSTRDGYQMTTFRTASETLDALAKGEVDAAFIWGPIAGYENKRRFQSRWSVTPVSGNSLAGQVAVAVPRGKDALLADINRALVELRPDIAALADKYGFPRATPVDTARAVSPLGSPLASRLAATPTLRLARVAYVEPAAALLAQADPQPALKSKSKAPVTKATKAPSPVETTPAAAPVVAAAEPVLSDAAKAGRIRFNDQCSHCHSVDGASPLPERNLRRVKARYDEKWREVAVTTIKNGRPDAGMPPWKDALSDADIEKLISFIETIQK